MLWISRNKIVVTTVTGLKYFNHYSSWKSNESIIKDSGVNLYINKPESSIHLVAFPTNIYFQLYLFIYNFQIKNKFLNKQLPRGAPWFSVLLRGAPQCGKKKRTVRFFIWCAGVAVYVRFLEVSARLLVVSGGFIVVCGCFLFFYGRLWWFAVVYW